MATCKDCIHEELCNYEDEQSGGVSPYFPNNMCRWFKNKADFVEFEVLRDWLWEIALNNVGEDLSIACQDIISRFDGLRNFAKERSAMSQVKLTDNERTILRSESMKKWEIDRIKRAIQSCKNKIKHHHEHTRSKVSNAIKNEYAKIDALEKQIPQAVKEFLPLNRAKCPACNGIMGAHASRKYCCYCGQALEWHEEE